MQTKENLKQKCSGLLTEIMTDVCRQLRENKVINIPKSRYMGLYDLTFDLKGDQALILKDVFQEWFNSYLKEQVFKNLTTTKDFIQTFIDEVAHLKTILKYMTILFQKYETIFGSQEIYIIEYGLVLFDLLIMNNDAVKQTYLNSYIDLINSIREKESNNEKQVLQNFLEILNYFTLAQKHRIEIVSIEKILVIQQLSKKVRRSTMQSPTSNCDNFLFPQVLEATRKFYENLSISWIKGGTSQEYVKRATKQFIIEQNLEDNFYVIFTKKNELHNALVNELLEQRVDQIVCNPNDGIQQLFQQMKNSVDLSPITRMYYLYKNSKTKIENLLNEFQIFVQTSITNVFAEQNNPNENQLQQRVQQQTLHLQQIDNLQIIYEYCMNLVANCFENSHKFRNHMELSFKEKINQVDRIVDKLAMHIHINLKQKLKETNNEQDKQNFDKFKKNILAFVQFVNSKGRLFQKITDDLKDRIFKGQIRNIGYEEEFLKGLRREHPEHLPSDLLTVWKDFKFYRNHDDEIRKQLEQQNLAQGVNFQFTVFTKTNSLKEFNNNNRRNEIILPNLVKPAVQFMEQFYSKKLQTEKKMLVWNYGIGQATLNIKFGPQQTQMIRLIVSNIQLIILQALKNSNGKTKSEILGQTGIQYEDDLIQQLKRLIDLNFVIYQQENQMYTLLKDQTKLKTPLKPNMPYSVIPDKQAESAEDIQMLRKERDIKIQSGIVRLMKTNKEMLYPEILQGVQRGLLGYYDFSAQDILAQIDELINGNYMRRDERVNNKFIYTPI